ncbi:uncharacterized protein LOC116248336 isoform X6 [Nymphaea colorata]|nr:uncharacterized protein LOC116248336 isoform X6 [Nymphaea colorata]
MNLSVTGWRYASPIAQHFRLYAQVRYGHNNQKRTRTCQGGTRDAPINGDLIFQMIEDLHEFDINIWRKSRLGSVRKDKLIAFGRIRLDDQVLGGRQSIKTWQLQRPPHKGADIAGEVNLVISCPLVQPVQNVPPSPSAPYGYPHR